MKSLLGKFSPGVFLALFVTVATGGALAVAQSNSTPAASPVPSYQPQSITYAPAPAPVLVCGGCGLHLEQPRPMMIAEPVAGQMRPNQHQHGPQQGYAAAPRAPRGRGANPAGYAPGHGPEPVVYFVGGMPPPRPGLPRTYYDLPAIQQDQRWVSPAGY